MIADFRTEYLSTMSTVKEANAEGNKNQANILFQKAKNSATAALAKLKKLVISFGENKVSRTLKKRVAKFEKELNDVSSKSAGQ